MTRPIKEMQDFSSVPTGMCIPSEEAYIRADASGAEVLWNIYDASGEKIGYASSRELAMTVAAQNDFIPFSVH